jgi:hypothetical protein
MSTFEFLVRLNLLNGRSFNDVHRYPIFPWLFLDCASKTLRNFGVVRSADPLPQMAVVTYLQGIEKFAGASPIVGEAFSMDDFASLAGGQFELTPEFFCMPELFARPNFALPPWAPSPLEFVYAHRKSLESDEVSGQINQWMSIVFTNVPKRDTIDKRSLIQREKVARLEPFAAVTIAEDGDFALRVAGHALDGRIGTTTVNLKKFLAGGFSQSVSVLSIAQMAAQTVSPTRTHSSAALDQPASVSESTSFTNGRKVAGQIKSLTGAIAFVENSDLTVWKTGKYHSMQIGNVNDVALDGIWTAVGCEDATVTLFREFRDATRIRLFREAVVAVAVSETFNIVVSGTRDSALIFCSTVNTENVKVVNLLNAEGVGITPVKILITRVWGFVVVYGTEIHAGATKYFIVVYTVNGNLVHRTEVGFPVDFWYSWASVAGFDYIVWASESGHLVFSEVMYINRRPEVFHHLRAQVLAMLYANRASALVVAAQERLYFIPLELR